ncbi:MAG: DUF3149 domain-containing protein [Thermoplasmatales archaeon]
MKVTGNRVLEYLSLILVVGAVVFYLGWSITYGDWNDIGLYSISVILILFGILGVVVSRLKMREEVGVS